ncbi:OpgC domain-containing protein [Rhizobium leguminosarum]|uniref:OpgC family protein n=1 Tax=Rhizobium leguminosarum TaxID=384 RepID=UPI002E1684AA|nr:OpgC domain-containing protein [Rhizobium leguminosarum]
MAGSASATGSRDPRLDFFRGLALVTIFVNHVPGVGIYEDMTTRNFGYSDAAEAFVLMSGMAAGLAYSKGLLSGDFLKTAVKVWSRAFKLYSVHIAISLAAVLVLLAGLQFFGETAVFGSVNVRTIVRDPFTGLLGLFSLGHQLGYFNILPLYMVLLVVTPFLVALAGRNKAALLAGSVAVWAAAGLLQANFPNYPTQGGWFLNPLSWQLVYVIGLLAGMSAKRDECLVPFAPGLFALSAGFLMWSLVVVRWQLWPSATIEALPTVFGGFDKTYLSLQRLLHVLALAYVVCSISSIRKVSGSLVAAPLVLLGRNSLAVFATGSVACIVLQVYRSVVPTNFGEDTLLLAGGLAVQFLAASGGVPRLPFLARA